MSRTIVQHDHEASVRVGGAYDDDGVSGYVLLDVPHSPAQLTPANARSVAVMLQRAADRAKGQRRGGST